MKKNDVVLWLNSFQKALDYYATNGFLKFTVTIWGKDRNDRSKHTKVSIDTQDSFPFLDMELFRDNRLRTWIHLKPNQKLKYLNSDSTHIPSCFKLISQGVLKQLSKLTTMTKEN